MPDDEVIRLRCRYCQDVIGVYEPLVLADDAGHGVTSLASEPWLHAAQPPSYHRSCYEQLAGTPAEN